MKKFFVIFCTIICVSLFNVATIPTTIFAQSPPKLAIVIDDFGEDRHGVEEMLNLPIPLTVAVMPFCEYSKSDAELANNRGHEVILHMPMENASASTPASYYGPVLIKNNFSEEEAVSTLIDSINQIPYCTGVNIHMGTGVSRNTKLITAMMNELKNRNMYFLDSKTVEDSVCPDCAKTTGIKFYIRDVFLEPPGRPNYNTAYNQLINAINVAKTKGSAVVIGHVGPVGMAETARAIKDILPKLEQAGIQVVKLSEL